MSHDTDKLIRQLSLVAFLMAERRPLTARDVKGNVEGYSEMSDEAFARRFYSDRAELTALGVPLNSQRDEFTGEELYTLRSENYFLDHLDLEEDELAALQTALYTLEGKFAYAEPLRLALQNLALGRPGFRHAPTATAERVRVTAPDYSPELGARLSKLEAAISKQRTIQFRYWSPSRDRETERRLNPYALRLDEGVWYVVGHDLDRDAIRTFRVARIRSDIRFATRRERDFRLPAEFDVEAHRVPRPWQVGPNAGTARIAVQGDTAWWVHRTLADAGDVVDGVFETPYSTLGPLASWILRQNGRAVPLEPPALCDEVKVALRLLRERHTGAAPAPARERRVEARPTPERQPAGPVAPERFGVLQALLAHLLAACGDARSADIEAGELAERFSLPREELQETLSLLNLVNFGGGCYTVYAEVDEETDRVHIDKELYGDVFRKAPKLTPLEARAIRLAIEYIGPTIAADADTPLERVRKKLEETFGQFELAPAPASRSGDDEEALVRTLSDGAEKRRVVELEYLKEGEEEPTTRLVEPYTIERELPYWRVHTWDRTVGGPRTYRLDRMRSARLTKERFEPRQGFDPNYLFEPAVARLWHAPPIARWKLERGARALTDKSATAQVTFKTEEWLLSEVLADRGETVVLEPAPMRRAVAARAQALQTELGLTGRRKRTAEPA
ncbi:MAG TPA: WYL domain-containing protein [Gaiella sp.]|uniref:WYL domain-containing protein n=1 Tax=Gaiella sp. TaxID=2663207 RepID=UPI002D7F5BA0|nr:WYL domain-containing protein [Gaiella sp.]HET9286870.1 WYL domain-containing protein [Gaiella sp.]